jgi:hypothetical protein
MTIALPPPHDILSTTSLHKTALTLPSRILFLQDYRVFIEGYSEDQKRTQWAERVTLAYTASNGDSIEYYPMRYILISMSVFRVVSALHNPIAEDD